MILSASNNVKYVIKTLIIYRPYSILSGTYSADDTKNPEFFMTFVVVYFYDFQVSFVAVTWLWRLSCHGKKFDDSFFYVIIVIFFAGFCDKILTTSWILDIMKEVNLLLILLLFCITSYVSCEDSINSSQKWPTVLMCVLARNKGHILPYSLSLLSKLDYPKDRMAMWWVLFILLFTFSTCFNTIVTHHSFNSTTGR